MVSLSYPVYAAISLPYAMLCPFKKKKKQIPNMCGGICMPLPGVNLYAIIQNQQNQL